MRHGRWGERQRGAREDVRAGKPSHNVNAVDNNVQVLEPVGHLLRDGEGALVVVVPLLVGHGHAVHGKGTAGGGVARCRQREENAWRWGMRVEGGARG